MANSHLRQMISSVNMPNSAQESKFCPVCGGTLRKEADLRIYGVAGNVEVENRKVYASCTKCSARFIFHQKTDLRPYNPTVASQISDLDETSSTLSSNNIKRQKK